MTDNTRNPKRELSDAQKQRIKDHSVSVVFTPNGTFETKSSEIITPKGLGKLNKQVSVVPDENETVRNISETPCFFEELQHINVILTNACNLSCTYCYEQHNKDFGRFTPDTLKEVYDFQVNSNDLDGKVFQFFGGEPLIHAPLILEFLRKHHEELERNRGTTRVSMITNGVLLNPKFIEEYFSYNFTGMSVSLDTINADVDHREIGQEKINHIIEMIGLIPQRFKDQHHVSIRCTLSVETAPELLPFIHTLYNNGIRTMVIHPLTMSSLDGFIKWPDEVWEQLHQDIVTAIETLPNFEIQFSEGVGKKFGNNCMVGSDMIAVDGSGDYSGCYFFTNHKENAAHTILGNILKDQVYVDRYKGFQETYAKMFEENEQCKTCDLAGLCYQCPAGNLDSGDGQMFRPDAMCQDIVRLFLTLQNDLTKKMFKTKFDNITAAVKEQGEQAIFAKAALHLMVKYFTGHHLLEEYLDGKVNDFPDYKAILQFFIEKAEAGETLDEDVDSYFDEMNTKVPGVNIKDFYTRLIDVMGVQNETSKAFGDVNDIGKRVFFLTLAHLVILNPKGEKLRND